MLVKRVPGLPIEFHGHNDLGMASANAVMAIIAGAQAVSVTVNGLGERAGNAALEEVVMACTVTLQQDYGINAEHFTGLSEYVASASGRPIPLNKPVTGKSVFMHESGIHVKAVMQYRGSFEPFSAQQIGGIPSEPVIGKHSGTSTLKYVMECNGITPGTDEVKSLLGRIRCFSTQKKRALTQKEVVDLYRETKEGNKQG